MVPPEKDPAVSSGTHADGLEQGPLVLPLELCADLHQVHLTAGHHDPGHHLLLGTFTLRGHKRQLSDVVTGYGSVSTVTTLPVPSWLR